MDTANRDTAVPPGTIRVTFLRLPKSDVFTAAVSRTITAARCVDELVKHGFLEPGFVTSYRLCDSRTGRSLPARTTFAEADVHDGDEFDVVSVGSVGCWL